MTSGTAFAALEDVAMREAWRHEALDFTPWLSANLDRLGQAIGIPLEHVESEASVETFAADILARNPQDDSLVLIENQLEASDHGHLGQIMTYLAGLSAQTIVWVAPAFREPHLSAIRWLNQHTADPFAFFAVKLRVVRIANSPLAPLFEVVERPNDWDRTLQEAARASRGLTDIGLFRKTFWTHFLDRQPAQAAVGPANADSVRWIKSPGHEFVVVQYLAQKSVGVFVRGPRGVVADQALAVIGPHLEGLSQRLGTPTFGGRDNLLLHNSLDVDSRDSTNWDRMSDWLAEQAARYVRALNEVMVNS